jgi:exodeoxyribonuclease-3
VRVISWNVNGLRSVLTKGFRPWLGRSRAAVVGLQEVRAREEQLPKEAFRGFFRHVVAAEKPGYSGVALLSKREPEAVETSLGDTAFDAEGRFQLARFGRLLVVNAYFPNGNGPNRDNSRVPYKLAFYRTVFERLEREKKRGAPILVMGDFNTAHREIDLARPKANVKTSGFTPVERAELDRWLKSGWVDTFRAFEAGPGHYSWWSQRVGIRERNVGWRIDYVLASPGAVPHLRGAFIQRHVLGSDHCPVGVELDDAVIGR